MHFTTHHLLLFEISPTLVLARNGIFSRCRPNFGSATDPVQLTFLDVMRNSGVQFCKRWILFTNVNILQLKDTPITEFTSLLARAPSLAILFHYLELPRFLLLINNQLFTDKETLLKLSISSSINHLRLGVLSKCTLCLPFADSFTLSKSSNLPKFYHNH